jgi:hypothetical protein
MPKMGYTGAYPMSDLRWSHTVIDWLGWTLRDNPHARGVFVGPNCKLCSDPDFWLKTKGVK